MKANWSKIVRLSLGVFVTAAFLCACFQQANAAVLALYNFTGNSLAPSTVAANLGAANISAGAGLGSGLTFDAIGNPTPSLSINAADTGTAFVLGDNDYFSFTVTANPGWAFNLNGSTLTFDAEFIDPTGGSDIANWELRTSVLGFGTTVGSGTFNDSGGQWDAQSTAFATSYDNLSSIEIRIYAWDPSTGTSMRFDNVTLNGAVVPEPVNVALGVFGLLAVGAGAGRRFYLRSRA